MEKITQKNKEKMHIRSLLCKFKYAVSDGGLGWIGFKSALVVLGIILTLLSFAIAMIAFKMQLPGF